MKHCVYVLAICVGVLLLATPAHADVTNLNYVGVATGIDKGPQDGVFESFAEPNLGSVNNNGWTSFRTGFEYSLSDFPAGSTINSANLTVVLYAWEGPRKIEVHGYSGDGTVQLSDLARDGLVGAVSVGPNGRQTLTLDVTSFVADLVAHGGTFAGFNVREAPANTSNFTVIDVLYSDTVLSINIPNIDKTPPTITASATRSDQVTYTAGAWTNLLVTVHFTCSDGTGSGVASCPPDAPYSAEGQYTASGTATDKAGNSASTSFGPINIDKTPPLVTYVSRAPAANAAGWNSTDVKVNWICADSLSGPIVTSFWNYLSTEGANQSLIGICSDRAGNLGGGRTTGINIDKTPPTITITSPQENATYLVHAMVPAAYSCVDALSGAAQCQPTGDPPDTFTVGSHWFIVASSDNAGNSGQKKVEYRVVYKFAGYYPPVDNPPTVNVAVAGQTIPIKWSLLDVSDKNISDPGVVRKYAYNPSSCASGTTDAIDQYVSAGSSSLEYSTGTNQFVLNWKTDPSWAGTCGFFNLELIDGNAYKAYFQFKK